MTPSPGRLLLDEMFNPRIADALNAAGHDCLAVAADASLRETSDADLLQFAVDTSRTFVTNNVSDVEPLRRTRAAFSEAVPPLIYTSDETFSRDRRFVARLTAALDAACRSDAVGNAGGVLWLHPATDGPGS